MDEATGTTTDLRRVRGDRTRQAILTHASRLASVEGLEAISLQRLAGDLGISKSGLFAHFGSKEELQLATVQEAARVFTEEVIKPGLVPPAGLRRVWALCDAYLSYVERRVFPGGCFFTQTAAEFDGRPGPVQDAVLEMVRYWAGSLTRAVRAAQEAGEISQIMDAGQLGWELDCLLSGASTSSAIYDRELMMERARRAIRLRLESAAAPSAPPLP